ncbi:hypothetical protein CRM22_002572 [Opisthorchis felineus]|uniref:Uncharacterized protein n=1 Tax=Opisthorchis felineus TaxID=147828 RepID=A0A4S2MBN4_OPIFE|nr:hypothetical protein CRM22_002572 [Opisthorchis felineus]TGZ71547.1 hypothetical protein CRM22_002572 [Opisthorchis felineus]
MVSMNPDPATAGIICMWLETLLQNLRSSATTDSGICTTHTTSTASPQVQQPPFVSYQKLTSKTVGLHLSEQPPDPIHTPAEGFGPLVSAIHTHPSDRHPAPSSNLQPTPMPNVVPIKNTPSVYTLFAWCPVDIKPDGGCRLAGFYKLHRDGPFYFITTGAVTSVSEDGKSVLTDGGHTFSLYGGISWWIYAAGTEKPEAMQLPTQIQLAFSRGFPTSHWRFQTQALYYFIATSQFRAPTDMEERLTQKNNPEPCFRTPNSANRLSKTIPSVQSPLGLVMPAPVYALRQDRQKDQDSVTMVSSGSSDSNALTTFVSASVVANQRTPVKRKGLSSLRHKAVNHFAESSDISSNNSSPSVSLSDVSQSKRHRKSTKNHTKHPSKRAGRPPTDRSPPLQNSASRKPREGDRYTARPKSKKTTEELFKIYTANGSALDIRDLEKTRSGRWVIPRLDSRAGQIVQVDEDGSVRITRGLGTKDTLPADSHRRRSTHH